MKKILSNKLLFFAVLLTALSILFIFLSPFPDGMVKSLDGTLAQSNHVQFGRIMTSVITFPILALFFGLIRSLFPSSDLSFGRKFSHFFVLAFLLLSCLGFLSSFVSFIRYFFEI